MYERSKSDHYKWSMSGEELTKDWYRNEYRGEYSMGFKDGNVRTEVEITYTDHSGEETISGQIIDAEINRPHFRFEDRSHGFPSFKDEGEKSQLLFQKSWEGKGGRRYKFDIEEIEVKAFYFEKPYCPHCGRELEYGYAEWDQFEESDGYTSQWLCSECFPKNFKKGVV